MNKTNEIRSLLGLTQEDMAHLLGVSRSHWSMYELGKRDLPTSALLLLARIEVHINKPEMAAKTIPQTGISNDQERHLLEGLLRENQYQQLSVTKKIAFSEQKYSAQIRRSEVIDHFNAQLGKTASSDKRLIDYLFVKNSLRETENMSLFQYRLKQELLQNEEILLQSKLNKSDSVKK